MIENAEIKQGIYYDLPNNEYHSCEGISKSSLDLIHRSPAHYIASLESPTEETPAMILGSAVHAAILEPDRFEEDYIVAPEFNKRTTAGKAAYAAWEMENVRNWIVVLSKETMAQVKAMRDSVLLHPVAGPLLEQEGKAETSIFWHEADILGQLEVAPDFVLSKCRPDKLLFDGRVLDLKTTQDARQNEFMRSVANFRYHVQQAYYTSGITEQFGGCGDFIFIAVEKAPPYAVNVVQLDEDAALVGREAYREDLYRYVKCKLTNEWPAYEPYIQTISLPRWAA